MDFNLDVAPQDTHCAFCGKETLNPYQAYANGEVLCCKTCEDLYFEFRSKAAYNATLRTMLETLIPPLFVDTSVERLKETKEFIEWVESDDGIKNKKSISVEQIIDWDYNPKGLLLYGESGAGKSRTLFKLIERIVEKDIIRLYSDLENNIKIFEGGSMKSEFEVSYKQFKSATPFISRCSSVKYLIIDDFAKEKFSDAYESALFQIIDKRTSRRKPTILTTNYVGESLKQKMVDLTNYNPLIRRLREFNTIIQIKPKME